MVEIEARVERLAVEPRGHLWICAEQLREPPRLRARDAGFGGFADRGQRAALNDLVRRLAREAGLDQREKHRLGEVQPAGALEVRAHARRMHDEPLYERGRARGHEV